MEEVWKALGINPGYEVSNLGAIRSLDRTDVRETYSRKIKGQPIKPFLANKTGYLQVKISGKKHSLHRLIAIAFCAGYSEGLVVNHKNGIRTDNRAENLEWVSHSENLLHAYRELGKRGNCLGKFSGDHHVARQVVSTDIKTGEQKAYLSGMDAVRDGYKSSSISRCCHGQYQSHKGRTWRFASDLDLLRITEWIGYDETSNRSAA